MKLIHLYVQRTIYNEASFKRYNSVGYLNFTYNGNACDFDADDSMHYTLESRIRSMNHTDLPTYRGIYCTFPIIYSRTRPFHYLAG